MRNSLKESLNKLQSSSLLLTIVVIFSKLIGMLRDVFLANYFGTSNISDAYLIAISVPTLLFYFIQHAITTSFLPIYNKALETEGKECADKFANNLTCISLLLCAVLVSLLLIFPNEIVKIFASGFNDETNELCAHFIRISACSLFFMTFVSIWTGYLQAYNNFIIPGIISLPRNIILIISIVLGSLIDVNILGFGILAAYISEALLLFPFVLSKKLRLMPTLNFKDPFIKDTLCMVIPIFIGVAVSQINKIVDRSIASTIQEGAVSALNYASVINNAVQEILATSIITILFAECSSLIAQHKKDEVKKKLTGTLNTLLFFLIPASLGIIVCSKELVSSLLCRGVFDENSLTITKGALCFYAIGLPFLAIRDTLIKVFYSYKETKITTVSSIIAICVNIGLNFWFMTFMGTNGLALATSISAIVHCLILYIILFKKIGDFGTKSILLEIGKTVVSTAIMVLILILLRELLYLYISSEILILGILVVGGLILYFVMSLLLHSNVLWGWLRNDRK